MNLPEIHWVIAVFAYKPDGYSRAIPLNGAIIIRIAERVVKFFVNPNKGGAAGED
ncbi:MAG: hypothetical protein IT554_03855 [Sphingomonadaceae bacterium]|nr:hypothetical protein [Sphingomonadaceae bacterium]